MDSSIHYYILLLSMAVFQLNIQFKWKMTYCCNTLSNAKATRIGFGGFNTLGNTRGWTTFHTKVHHQWRLTIGYGFMYVFVYWMWIWWKFFVDMTEMKKSTKSVNIQPLRWKLMSGKSFVQNRSFSNFGCIFVLFCFVLLF